MHDLDTGQKVTFPSCLASGMRYEAGDHAIVVSLKGTFK